MGKKMIALSSGVIGVIGGAIIGAMGTGKVVGSQVNRNRKMSDKYFSLFLMMNQWVKVKQEGKSIASYLESKGISDIAIYGMSHAGERLLEELKDSAIAVKYGIDQNAEAIDADIDLWAVDDNLPKVDAIIVTPIFFFDEIEEMLGEKVDCPIISLEDILYEA